MNIIPDVTPAQVTNLLTLGATPGTYQRPYPNGTAVIEVSFLKSRPVYTNPDFSNSFANGPEGDGFRPLTPQQIKQTKAAFAAISKVANIDFTYTDEPGPGAIRIGIADVRNNRTREQIGGVSLRENASYQTPSVNDLYIGIVDAGLSEEFAFGSKPFTDLLHEIGHALGLNHLNEIPRTTNAGESKAASVMAYAKLVDENNVPLHGANYGMTPLILDVAALQELWGARALVQTGNTTYTFNPTAVSDSDYSSNNATTVFWNQIRTIWDTDGIDTLDARDYRETVSIDLRPGYLSSIGIGKNISVAFGAEIENATGGKGNDKLIGNDLANVLDGGAADDKLEGGAGGDTYNFNGAFGNDTVLDLDGLGTLKFDGVAMPLATLKRYATDDVWKDASGQFLFTTVTGEGGNKDLRITKYKSATDKKVQGTVTVRNFQQGMLGLTLAQTAETPPTEGSSRISLDVLMGKADDPSVPAGREVPRLYESGISLVYRSADDQAKWVYANHSDGGQTIETGAGDDRIFVGRLYNSPAYPGPENWGPSPGEDEDYVIAGGGDDVVTTGYGSDVIEGGDGDDYLLSAAVGSFSQTPLGETIIHDLFAVQIQDLVNISQNHDPADSDSSDIVDGGAGNDWIRSGLGNDILFGGIGDDFVFGMEGNDLLAGGEGHDFIYGDGLYVTQHIEFNGEFIFGYSFEGNDALWGEQGHDHLIGGIGKDQIFGGDGNDFLYGDSDSVALAENLRWIPQEYHANDDLDGGDGNDFLLGGGGADVLQGSAGNDALRGDIFEGILVEMAYQGDDELDGGDGEDSLYGDGGADLLFGGEGSDLLRGGDGNDLLIGGGGFDNLDGGKGDDIYEFHLTDFDGAHEVIADSEGMDVIKFMSGLSVQDMIIRRQGNDMLIDFADMGGVLIKNGGANVIESLVFSDGTVMGQAEIFAAAVKTSDGDDFIQVVQPNTPLDGGRGDDRLVGDTWDDYILGGDGNDILYGAGGSDVLDGGGGDDQLLGGASGHAVMIGGSGRDIIKDSGSNTTYRFHRDSDVDLIYESGGTDEVELSEGISPSDIIIRNIGRDLFVATPSSQLLVGDMFQSWGEIRQHAALEFIRFADGLVWNLPQILQKALLATDGDDSIYGFGGEDTIEGGIGNDSLYGVNGSDNLRGGAGNDYLSGGAGGIDVLYGGEGDDYLDGGDGADTLDGGAGNDTLDGGLGNNTYLFGKGDGQDRVDLYSDSALNALQFKEGVLASEISLKQVYDSQSGITALEVSIAGTTDKFLINRFFNSAKQLVQQFRFADGVTWDYDALVRMADPSTANHAPVLAGPLPTLQATIGTTFTHTVGSGAFTDQDSADVLTYEAKLANGESLPTWLSFNGQTRTFTGTPSSAHAGAISVLLSASDMAGAKATGQFTLSVEAHNNPPVVNTNAGMVEGVAITENAPWSLSIPAALFSDPDADDSVSTTIRSVNGEWPSWLTYNAATRTLSGTPPSADGGKHWELQVVGTDLSGASAHFDFSVAVNRKPVVMQNITAQTASQGTAWNYTIPAASFSEPDNEAFTLSATLSGGAALPSWLNFNANTRGFSGVANAPLGTYEISVVATDIWGATGVQTFVLTVQVSTINGTSGNDTLRGTTGNDTIDGKAGADSMTGLVGDDIYIVDNTGDRVIEASNAGSDTVRSSVTHTLAANVENLTLTGTGALNGTGNALSNRLIGNAGVNVLTGAAGADYMEGAGGTDTLAGGAGNDTYMLARGYGTDTILENDTTSGNLDIAKFAADVSANQLWFRKISSNLEVSVIGTNDKFLVSNWYSGSRYQVERFEAGDGKAITSSQVQNLVQAMASFSPPAMGQTQMPVNYQSQLANVIAANWQ